jgi:hypothetical protein
MKIFRQIIASIAVIIPNIIYMLKIIRKFWSKTSKVRRLISFISVFKVLTTNVFKYQSFLLSVDYLKYETVIDLKLDDSYAHYSLAISFLRSKLLRSDFENLTITHYIGNVKCQILEV